MKKNLLVLFLLGGIFFYGESFAAGEDVTITSATTTATESKDVKSSEEGEEFDFETASIEEKYEYLNDQEQATEASLAELQNDPAATEEYDNAEALVKSNEAILETESEKLTTLQSDLEELEVAENPDESKIKEKESEIDAQEKVVETAESNVEKAQEDLDSTAIGTAISNLGKTKAQKALWQNVYNSSEFDIHLLTVDGGNEDKLRITTMDLEKIEPLMDEVKELEKVLNDSNALDDHKDASETLDTANANEELQIRTLENLQQELEYLESVNDPDPTKVADKMTEITTQEKVVEEAKENVTNAQEALDNTEIEKTRIQITELNEQIVSYSGTSDYDIFNRIIDLMMGVIGTAAVLMLIVGGYFFVVLSSSENHLQKAKNIFIQTIFGLIVAFLSVLIVQTLFAFLF